LHLCAPSAIVWEKCEARQHVALRLEDRRHDELTLQQNLASTTLDATLRYIGNLDIAQRQPPSILRSHMRWLKGA
jgi:hypothetical protein